MPADYLAVARNVYSIVSASGMMAYDAVYKSSAMNSLPITVRPNDSLGQLFDLQRLPIGMRKVVAVILLLPFGVLMTAVFRNLVGLQTFGTFAPSLLALSFVMSDWRTGLMILIVVLAVGYIGLWAMDHMKLLMVPRIGLILTLVIMLMTLAISIFDYLTLTPSANAVLLPTVIIAMLIERIFITEVEDGVQNVLKLLAGPLLWPSAVISSWLRCGCGLS